MRFKIAIYCYFASGSGGEVLQWARLCVCLSVCVSVCSQGYLPNHTRDFSPNFCVCCLWPWLGPPPVNLKNSVSKVFTASPIDVVVFKFRRNRALFIAPKKQENFDCLTNCSYCTDRAQNLPGPAPNNVLTVLQISSKFVDFRRSYSRSREHRFCAP